MKIDKTKPFATVHGLPGVKFEQDGKAFDVTGEEVFELVEEQPEAIPAIEIETPQETAYQVPEIEDIVMFQCGVCGRYFKSNAGLQAHLRSHRHDLES